MTAVRTAFEPNRARRYDRTFEEPGNDGYALRSRLAHTLRLLGHGPGEALDVGMGAGRLCYELAARGWLVSGLDASREMVALARERLPEAANRFAEGPIESLPYADESFDAVVATGVLEYSVVEAAVFELARVLRPGGTAIVSYPNPAALLRFWKTSLYYPAVKSIKKRLGQSTESAPEGRPLLPIPAFRSLLEEAGLAIEETLYSSHVVVLPPLDAAMPRASERLAAAAAAGLPRLDRWLGTQIVFRCVRGRRFSA